MMMMMMIMTMMTTTISYEPVVLVAHFVGKLFQFGRDFILISGLNECNLTTAAEEEPHDLTATHRTASLI